MDPGSTEPSRSRERSLTGAEGDVRGGTGLTSERSRGRASSALVEVFDEQDDHPDCGVDVETLRQLGTFSLGLLWERAPKAVGRPHVDVTLVDPERMTVLNGRHMGESSTTDVLAFPMDAPDEAHPGVPSFLGDVVLCPLVAAAQASAAGQPPADELEMLLVHGILHLFGHDHADAEERRVMFALTDELLAMFRGRRVAETGAHP